MEYFVAIAISFTAGAMVVGLYAWWIQARIHHLEMSISKQKKDHETHMLSLERAALNLLKRKTHPRILKPAIVDGSPQFLDDPDGTGPVLYLLSPDGSVLGQRMTSREISEDRLRFTASLCK